MDFVSTAKVKRIPPRVLTPTTIDDPSLADKNIKAFDIPKRTKLEELIDDAFNKRDKLIGGLLDLDNKYDMLKRVIDDQLKNMDIPVSNRATREAVRAFGGNGNNITADIYNKAKKIAGKIEGLNASIGLNPLHIPFAKPTKNGKALTQYAGDILRSCGDIDPDGFPNKKIVISDKKKETMPYVPSETNNLDEDGIGAAGQNDDGSLLTLIQDLLDKAKYDILEFLKYTLWWDVLYKKFILKLVLFHPKVWIGALEPWTRKEIIGKFIAVPHCLLIKLVYWLENIPGIIGIRPPTVSGDKRVTEEIVLDEYELEKTKSGSWLSKIHDKLFKKGELDEDTIRLQDPWRKNRKPFKKEGLDETLAEIDECSENLEDNRKNERDEDDPEDEIANNIWKCTMNRTYNPDEPDGNDQEVKTEPCFEAKIKAANKEATSTMGTGIDENVPKQEGFIPPSCYDYAKTILDAVRNNALWGNKDNKYNSAAIFLDNLVGGCILRDFHEVSKFMVYVQDDSAGSKALRDNTSKHPKYKQIFMNKDVEDFRDVIIRGKNG